MRPCYDDPVESGNDTNDLEGVGMMKTTVYHGNHTVSLDEVLDGTINPGLVYTKQYALGGHSSGM